MPGGRDPSAATPRSITALASISSPLGSNIAGSQPVVSAGSQPAVSKSGLKVVREHPGVQNSLWKPAATAVVMDMHSTA